MFEGEIQFRLPGRDWVEVTIQFEADADDPSVGYRGGAGVTGIERSDGHELPWRAQRKFMTKYGDAVFKAIYHELDHNDDAWADIDEY